MRNSLPDFEFEYLGFDKEAMTHDFGQIFSGSKDGRSMRICRCEESIFEGVEYIFEGIVILV